MNSPSPSPPFTAPSRKIDTRRRWLFRAITITLGLLIGLIVAEIGLRVWQRQMARSDQLEPGLVQHDPTLGWFLNPAWRGRHRHLDFDVAYTVMPAGFRADPQLPAGRRGRRIAVVGDSFTFGLGVNDDETFVSLLNRDTGDTWLNCGIPAFSTDQEVLLLERDVLRLRPDEVLLVVYLANDVLDNLRSAPLQANGSKPFFTIDQDRLELRNSPVRTETGQAPPTGDLGGAVIGPGSRIAWRRALEGRCATFRLLSESLPVPDLSAEFESRFAFALDLMDRLIARAHADCQGAGVQFQVVLLGGRSFVEAPRSASGQFQEYVRKTITANCARRGIGVLDVAKEMRRQFRANEDVWFHPNEGHFNQAGHAFAADFIGTFGTGRLPAR